MSLASGLVLLAAAAGAPSELVLHLSVDPARQEKCLVQADDQRFDLGDDADRKRFTDRYPPATTPIPIDPGEAPYRCIGAVIFALQRENYQRLNPEVWTQGGARRQ